MLPGLTWFGPFAVKSLCPHTRFADLDPAGNCSTRWLCESATKTFPFGSSFTSKGDARPFSDASGAVPGFAEVDAKSDSPSTFFAAAPIAGALGKTRTRL